MSLALYKGADIEVRDRTIFPHEHARPIVVDGRIEVIDEDWPEATVQTSNEAASTFLEVDANDSPSGRA